MDLPPSLLGRSRREAAAVGVGVHGQPGVVAPQRRGLERGLAQGQVPAALGHAPRPRPVLETLALLLAEEDEALGAGVGHLLAGVEQHPRAGDRAVLGQPWEPALRAWKKRR